MVRQLPRRRVVPFGVWLWPLLAVGLWAVLVSCFVRLVRQADGLTTVQGLASLSNIVAMLLTATYVAIMARQLEIMKTQLDEMKSSRLYQNQPVVVVSVKEVRVERPRLYSDPSTDADVFLCRIEVDYRLKNIGIDPAISVCVKPSLRCKSGNAVWTEDAARETLEYLTTMGESDGLSSLFLGGEDCLFLKGLLETQPDIMHYASDEVWTRPPLDSTPFLEFAVTYANPLGGRFVSKCTYRVGCGLEAWETAKKWLALLQTAPLTYRDYLRCISAERYRNREQADEAYRTISEDLERKVGLEALAMRAHLLPSRSRIYPLREDGGRGPAADLP